MEDVVDFFWPWYNASKMDMINQAKAQLSWRYSELITPYLKKAWEKVD